MRVLLTGATGFVGSYLVPELLDAGHRVLGLTRSAGGARALSGAGAEPVRGDVNDLEELRALAGSVDGVIHAAFDHDPSAARRHGDDDRRVVETLGAALGASGRPLVVSSGTGLVAASSPGAAVVETDPHRPVDQVPRAATEQAAEAVGATGVRVMVLRLGQVHDTRSQGRISRHVAVAREQGRVAYVGDGLARVPAVHVGDAVDLYRRVLEHGEPGARYHAVDEEGVALRAVAETIGTRLGLPAVSIDPADAPAHFGDLAGLAASDLPASAALTRRALGWHPTGPDLLADLRHLDLGRSPSDASTGGPTTTGSDT